MKLLIPYILIASQAAFALPSDPATAPAPRNIDAVELEWQGAIDNNGTTVTLTGTAESIFKQIIVLNPNYEQERDDGLRKRDPINSASIICNVFNPAERNAIDDGISYLYGIGNGLCRAPSGRPGAPGCARVSCSWSAGIFLCNDQNFEAQIPCRLVADNARGIADVCSYHPFPQGYYCHGQIWSFNRAWNVVINRDNYNC
ncbi:hypothetical protein B0H66DRAFT_249825 [Apodospora peruviana]|uniref:Uncharacterized protein n=1 Tax=Apodospora peruviana TaxID=516989 RepID=A0AAE0I5E1_9PEZI|nr:hypothetical protein B0H66DRAFT_249825 [Apodospora peruviana]